MKKLTAATLALAVLAALTPTTAERVSATETNDHVFECGEDNPPSGTHLDLGVLMTFEFDCKTGILTPTGDSVNLDCVGTSATYRFWPAYGLCLSIDHYLSANGMIDTDRYQANLYVAVVGEYRDISWSAWRVDTNEVTLSCGDALCDSLITHPCVAEIVTFCMDGQGYVPACATEFWVTGSVTGKNPAPPKTVQAARDARVCQHA